MIEYAVVFQNSMGKFAFRIEANSEAEAINKAIAMEATKVFTSVEAIQIII